MGANTNESDQNVKKRMEAAVNNLSYKSPESKDLAKAMGLL
jgi:hypothetical protein|tara:strand:+ start:2041 stop:2163 length:123 start_codon:yes stop_codon:yes gene_type:complete